MQLWMLVFARLSFAAAARVGENKRPGTYPGLSKKGRRITG
jgi:hypothetical protein